MLHYLKPYASFATIQEMDDHIKQHLNAHALTKTERAILLCLSQHALATPGATHLKAQTIASKLNCSTKTVYRAVKKLHELGIINKHAQTKMNGIKAATIYVICRYVPSEMSERPQAENKAAPSDERQSNANEALSFQSSCSKNNLITSINKWHEKLQHYFECYPLQTAIQQPLFQSIPLLNVESEQQFERAKYILVQCTYLVTTKQITLYSSFEKFVLGAYEKWILPATVEAPVQQPPNSTRPVPFYNWLDERE